VDVDIDDSRQDSQVSCIDFVSTRGQLWRDRGDEAVLDSDVGLGASDD
jgi:hypothetical protein